MRGGGRGEGMGGGEIQTDRHSSQKPFSVKMALKSDPESLRTLPKLKAVKFRNCLEFPFMEESHLVASSVPSVFIR